MKQRRYIKLDLHGMNRYEAKRTIINDIKHLDPTKKKWILAIHGYRNGQVIRNYIRSPYGLQNDFDKEELGWDLKVVPFQEGATALSPKRRGSLEH